MICNFTTTTWYHNSQSQLNDNHFIRNNTASMNHECFSKRINNFPSQQVRTFTSRSTVMKPQCRLQAAKKLCLKDELLLSVREENIIHHISYNTNFVNINISLEVQET
eukprot:TRINITY_DN741_c0_g1_i2.p1 TRINITY_DN741_c0_g1~~TRINITY_DN741_c0_g1_i2.p1  ORF type:complete len:108 (-),score=0.56 TRINITY_DN741_c0_g1_i2:91-414(-)